MTGASWKCWDYSTVMGQTPISLQHVFVYKRAKPPDRRFFFFTVLVRLGWEGMQGDQKPDPYFASNTCWGAAMTLHKNSKPRCSRLHSWEPLGIQGVQALSQQGPRDAIRPSSPPKAVLLLLRAPSSLLRAGQHHCAVRRENTASQGCYYYSSQ